VVFGPLDSVIESNRRPVSLRAAKPNIKIECVAGCGSTPDGTAPGTQLMEPFGVAFDRQGNWYICEYKGQRVTKIDAKGMSSAFAGRRGDSQEPESATAGKLRFHDPHGLVIGKDQQMYVADTLNHRVVKIDLKTGRAATIAGTGQAGYSGDGGPAVKGAFNQLYAVDLNRAGDKLYLTDLRNRRIRLLDLKSGVVTTVAGNGQEGIPTDGAVAINSPLVDPRAVTVDSKDNVYILERRGNALRLLDKQGKIQTVIGPNKIIRAPELNGPKHLCVDRRDHVLIADSENHLIRKYNPQDGSLEVIAGTGEKGSRLVPDDPLKTQLSRPHGVYVHASGALYISDSDNHRVLKLSNWF
jgi:sugar lactone lactonase YvrE